MKKRTGRRIGLLIFVVIVAIIAIVAATSGSNGTTYRSKVLGTEVVDSQELRVAFSVTNTGKHAGSPTCNVNATSPGGADSGFDAFLPPSVAPGHTWAGNGVITITNNGARNVRLSGVTVSCS